MNELIKAMSALRQFGSITRVVYEGDKTILYTGCAMATVRCNSPHSGDFTTHTEYVWDEIANGYHPIPECDFETYNPVVVRDKTLVAEIRQPKDLLHVLPFASKDIDRPILTHVYIQDGKAWAADGFRGVELQIKASVSNPVMLKPQWLKAAARMSDVVRVYSATRYLFTKQIEVTGHKTYPYHVIEAGPLTLAIRDKYPEHKYPDFGMILEAVQADCTYIIHNVDELEWACKKLKTPAKEEYGRVQLTPEGLRFHDLTAEMHVDIQGQLPEVYLNVNYLADVAKVCKPSPVTFNIGHPHHAVGFFAERITGAIMPMKGGM